MLSVKYFDGTKWEDLSADSIKEYLDRKEGVLWVDIETPKEDEFVLLETEFRFHELAIEDCIFPHNQPKLDDYKDYLFLVFHTAKLENKGEKIEITQQEINFFLGDNFLVSVHEDKPPAWNTILEKIKKRGALVSSSSDGLLHLILDTLVDAHFPIVEDVEDLLDELSEELLVSPSKAALEKVFLLKRNIAHLRKILSPQRTILATLSRISHNSEKNIIREPVAYYFKDIYDHLVRLVETLSSYQERASYTLEIYMSSVTHKISEVIKMLTVVATIFLPILLVASYYGMNVDFPELIFGKFNIFFIWGVAIFFTLTLFLYLKKRGWF